MNQMLRVLSLFLVYFLVEIQVDGRPHCDMTEAYADECGKKLIFIGEHTTKLPKTDDDMKEQCNNIDTGLQCLKKYSKACLDPFATQMFNIIVKNGDKLEAKYCKDDKGRNDLLHHMNCNEHSEETLGTMRMCMDKFIVQMEHIGEVEGDHRIPATCCSFHVMDKCVKESLSKVCSKEESVKYINNFLTELTGEVVKTGCGKFDNLGHCEANMDKKEWQLLKDLVTSDDPNVIKSKRINDSPFVALRNVMKQLMED